jgi:ATP-binding cassette subfamily B protein
MDCGPACMQALLEGFSISANYNRVRDLCQTNATGTSLSTIEEKSQDFGLVVEQVMLPEDHVFLAESRTLPAVVVVRMREQFNHLVVAWSCHGEWVQVMDPEVGRRWPRRERFSRELYLHHEQVTAAAWREWAGSNEFVCPLRSQLRNTGVRSTTSKPWIDAALTDSSWHSLGLLDAATRMTNKLVDAGVVHRGREAERVLDSVLEVSRQRGGLVETRRIPKQYWSVRPAPEKHTDLIIHGPVLLRVVGRQPLSIPSVSQPEAHTSTDQETPTPALGQATISAKKTPSPMREVFRILALLHPLALITATTSVVLGAGGVLLEGVLLRALFDLGLSLATIEQRLIALSVVIVGLGSWLMLNFGISRVQKFFGRRVEGQLRVALLSRIPNVADAYFRSRLVSDLAERAHAMHLLGFLPQVGLELVGTICQLVFLALALAWLDPASALAVATASVVLAALPFLTYPLMVERELSVRTHGAALTRYYLDSLRGLVAIRFHGAERALRTAHENSLDRWRSSNWSYLRLAIGLEAVQSSIGLLFVGWLIFHHTSRSSDPGTLLLFAYWVLNLPLFGRRIAGELQSYASCSNAATRLLEPLSAPEEQPLREADTDVTQAEKAAFGMRIEYRNVTVVAQSKTILADIDLSIEAGSHVAIVGRSGAGKTSLVGLLLGWLRPVTGDIFVDEERLTESRLQKVRRETAWVDPAVHLWNRSLLENLSYAEKGSKQLPFAEVIDQVQLVDLLKTLPDGLQTSLGESGQMVSGGEGQRVRLGRALMRGGARLAILDEPFRGLDYGQRRQLLQRARLWWSKATLLCVTHDIEETLLFDRVLVIEEGRVIEDGSPLRLREKLSHYSQMLRGEKKLQKDLWSKKTWRKLWMEDGRLYEKRQLS